MRRQPAPGGRHEQPRVRCDEEPSSVAGVAANRQADAFMCAHGSPLLGGKDSKYVRPFEDVGPRSACPGFPNIKGKASAAEGPSEGTTLLNQ